MKVLRLYINWNEAFKAIPSIYTINFSLLQWTGIVLIWIALFPILFTITLVVFCEVASIGMRLKNFRIRHRERLSKSSIGRTVVLKEVFATNIFKLALKIFEGTLSMFIGICGAGVLIAYPFKWAWNYIIPRVLGFPNIGTLESFCLCIVAGILVKGISKF